MRDCGGGGGLVQWGVYLCDLGDRGQLLGLVVAVVRGLLHRRGTVAAVVVMVRLGREGRGGRGGRGVFVVVRVVIVLGTSSFKMNLTSLK